jgi:hypothetical protein
MNTTADETQTIMIIFVAVNDLESITDAEVFISLISALIIKKEIKTNFKKKNIKEK